MMRLISVTILVAVGVQASSDSLRQSVLESLEAPVVGELCNCSAECRANGDPHVYPFGYDSAYAVRPNSGTILTMYDMDKFGTGIDVMAEGNANNPTAAWVSEVYTNVNNVRTLVANVDDCTSNNQILYTNTFSETSGIEVQSLDVNAKCVFGSGIDLRGKHFRIDLYLSKEDQQVPFDNFFDFELGNNGNGECFGNKYGTSDQGNAKCLCQKIQPTMPPTMPFIPPCTCVGKCSMKQDPYVWDFNNRKQPYFGDAMWHTVYEFDSFLIQGYFTQGTNGAEWVQNITVNDELYDVSMCWGNWGNSAPNNCATRSNNARYKFPTLTIPSLHRDTIISVDVHCICKDRIKVPLNTRLDMWLTVNSNDVPVPLNPGNNPMLEYEIDNGGTGMCYPGYDTGNLDASNNTIGPVCTCPI